MHVFVISSFVVIFSAVTSIVLGAVIKARQQKHK